MTSNDAKRYPADDVWGWDTPHCATVDPWALNLHGYSTPFIDGWAMMDDYGTLFHVPFRRLFAFFVQGQ
jgi:hypothetical protein